MPKRKQKFGKKLKEKRIEKGLSLRKICRMLNYDPSNWSKIERGIISPPSDEKILKKWAKALSFSREETQDFIDEAKIAQGVIPEDILSRKNAAEYLPAFFRTLRNKKPTKKEIDKLIETIRKS